MEASSNDSCLHVRFERRAAETPDASALTCSGETLTYAELNKRANQLARHLQSMGVGHEDLVGLCLDRSIDTVVSILAVLKAGGAYVPMDPFYPAERVRMIVEEAQCKVVVLHEAQTDRFADEQDVALVVLDGEKTPWDGLADGNIDNLASGDSLNYVMFTSGSTGKPKGVPISHWNVVRLFTSTDHWFHFSSDESWAVFHSYSFDLSVWEMWGALLHGGRVVMVPYQVGRSPEDFYQLLVDEQVTHICQTPSAFRQLQLHEDTLPESAWKQLGLRCVVVAGEALSFHSLGSWFARHGDDQPQIINMYGITETTVYVTYRRVFQHEATADMPSYIGVPIPDQPCYILDEHLKPVEIGEEGELYVGGEGNATGYFKRPDLTEARFIPNPFDPNGGTLYKSGDLVRREEGDMAYIGRIDTQVQIRGFRVELGEIEAKLLAHDEVLGAVVRLREDTPGDQRLVGYYLADAPVATASMRTHLAATLPPYMVPSRYVHMDAFPLNGNGKIDSKALPAPTGEMERGEFVAPHTEHEKALAEIWQTLLGVSSVGCADDFLDLGGHSLLATQLVARLEEQFSVRLPLRAILESTTLSAQAEALSRAIAAGTTTGLPALKAVDHAELLSLSSPQEQLWILSKFEKGLTAYNISLLCALEGSLDFDRFEAALNRVIARHEALRMIFIEEAGVPRLAIQDQVQITVPMHDLRTLTAVGQGEELKQRARRLAQQPMPLDSGPLIRGELYRVGTTSYRFALVIHHIVFDGWSISVLLHALSEAYGENTGAAPSSRPACDYAAYVVWQREQLKSAALEPQRNYWRRQLRGPLPILEVPTDFPRPPRQTFRGDVCTVTVSPEQSDALKALASAHRVTPFVVMLAGWKALLYRYTGQEDCIVGIALAGRSRVEFEPLIGYFINTVAIRTALGRDLPFAQLLDRVHDVTRSAQDNQDIPFAEVVADCQIERDPSRTPIFQGMFVYHNTPEYRVQLGEVSIQGREYGNGGAKFDLTMAVLPTEVGFELSLEYNTDLYKKSTVETLLERFVHLLASGAADPARAIGQLPLAEAATLVAPPLPSPVVEHSVEDSVETLPVTLHGIFEAQVARRPEAPAVACDGTTVSYFELNVRANQVAHYLLAHGVARGTMVGLCLDRSIDTIVAILGVLKAGAAYVPMDPVYPAERMQLIIEDAECPVVITHVAQRERFDAERVTVLVLDHIDTDLACYPAENPRQPSAAEDLAYVIYTSGSTGKPKGALIYHQNVTRLVTGMEKWFTLDETDSFTMFHSYAFDYSVWELWGALNYGGKVVMVPYVVSRSPEQFYQLLVDEQVTVLSQTPSSFKQLQFVDEQRGDDAQTLSLRYVLVGGEAVDLPGFRSWFDRHGTTDPEIYIVYGITETTVFITCRVLTFEDTEPGTPNYIGTAIDDLSAHVLDEAMTPVAPGEVGELYVGGAGVGGGYLRRPELNRVKFVPDPFGEKEGGILYKTGDLVRLLEGDLEFIGRNDHQVQLRGFRVELGEIESVLNGLPDIRSAIVRAREDQPGDMRLVAYYLAADEVPLATLRAGLLEKLPAYMVPSHFLHLSEFPLNNNGKVDVDALPAPGDVVVDVAPDEALSDVEAHIAELWSAILRAGSIRRDDNFFELGGHSLLAIQVLNQINEHYNKGFDLRDFFDAPTVAAFARLLEEGGTTVPSFQCLVELKKGTGIPFFCLKGAGDVGGTYETFAKALDDSQPFYGFPDLDFEALEESGEPVTVETIARCCIEEIRAVRPHGPYYLGGYSFGGLVAYEMARQLLEAGEEVPFLAMLDSSIPDHAEVPPGFTGEYLLHQLNRLWVRLYMTRYTWKLLVGYARDAIRLSIGRLFKGPSDAPVRLTWRDYVRWIQLDTSVQYYLIHAGLVKPSIRERRLEMVKEQLVRHSTRSMVSSKQAMAGYTLKPIPVKITLFRAEHNPSGSEKRDPTFGWEGYAQKGVEVVVVPGNHMVLIRWPFANDLGKALQNAIDTLANRPEDVAKSS